MDQKAYLTLENGRVFEGTRFGAQGDVTGEVVFTTGMVGYLETLTDKNYHGQIVLQTFPLIGNYGVIPEDFESDRPHLRAYIVKEFCTQPSNFRAQGDLDAYLREQGVIGLCGIDTRALTKLIREQGAMRGAITSGKADMAALRSFAAEAPVQAVTCREITREGSGKTHVVLWDFGAGGGIGKELLRRGARVTTVPASTGADEIAKLHPDGILLSNGPGDPAANPAIIAQVARAMELGIPMMGICLGHQFMALARGAASVKLKYGHRGTNQPVRDLSSGRVYITNQNHGYATRMDSFDSLKITPRFVNVNDGTCEGADYPGLAAFSVQFYPGSGDTAFVYDRFFQEMEAR